jgi:hypothetical protein
VIVGSRILGMGSVCMRFVMHVFVAGAARGGGEYGTEVGGLLADFLRRLKRVVEYCRAVEVRCLWIVL